MKIEWRSEPDNSRWFPYLDTYKAESEELSSGEIIGALDPYIMEERKERIRRAVENRIYSVCLVVEGLSDFKNVSAAFRFANALGIQAVHVISSDGMLAFEAFLCTMLCERISRLGHRGDLTAEESQILLAEFFLCHREHHQHSA